MAFRDDKPIDTPKDPRCVGRLALHCHGTTSDVFLRLVRKTLIYIKTKRQERGEYDVPLLPFGLGNTMTKPVAKVANAMLTTRVFIGALLSMIKEIY